MTWQEKRKAEPLLWLSEPDCPGARYLALRDLADLADDDPELGAARQAAYRDGPIASILAEMNELGYWCEPGPGYLPKYYSSVWSIISLAQLGAKVGDDQRISQACTYLLDHALTQKGHFTTNGSPSGTADCLQGNLCWALIEMSCKDNRLEKAFEWMARSVTGEGVAPATDRKAEWRYYAGKCGPLFACGANNKKACAWGAVKVMLAFSRLPVAQRTPSVNLAIQQGIDFLLSIDPATAAYPCGWNEKPSGNWWKFGFPVFYVTDILQLAEALVYLGYGQDKRLDNTFEFILSKQDAQGRWSLDYDYQGKTWGHYGEKKKPNKWVTLRALQVVTKAV